MQIEPATKRHTLHHDLIFRTPNGAESYPRQGSRLRSTILSDVVVYRAPGNLAAFIWRHATALSYRPGDPHVQAIVEHYGDG